jgi:hypothetical protein
MHDGDPRGQLTEEKRTNTASTQCHQQFSTSVQLTAHTGHDVGSTGSFCYNCHMPRIVYGVMSAHLTHHITIPWPDKTVRFDKPNACNQCHVDRSVSRVIAETKRLWPKTFFGRTSGGEGFNEPEGLRALFAGDAVMRALTAAAMMPASDVTAPWLLEAMQDRYPIVRYFAANDLAAKNPTLPKPDYLAPTAAREATLRNWYPLWPSKRLEEAQETRKRVSVIREETDVGEGE